MPRKPRYFLACVPCHVVQRGHNREPCFAAADDYRYYLQCLRQAGLKYQVAIHAYVLMTNHVHLLLTPATAEGIPQLMQSLGRRYVQYVNVSYRRSGTLWEGRFRASLIDTERYLLSCYCYIELNPIRAGMVAKAEDYPWSSFGANGWGHEDRLSQPHEIYQLLGATPEEQQRRYRELLAGLDDQRLQELRTGLNRCVPVGNDRFKDAVDQRLQRRISYRPRGWPRKEAADSSPGTEGTGKREWRQDEWRF